MEQIITEHLSNKNLYLIFAVEPIFFKKNNGILFNDDIVFAIETNIISSDGIYRNGKQEGLWIYWYPNGQKLGEGYYRNGKEDGLWITWWENGQKESEGYYHNELKEGLWIFWYQNGQIASDKFYRNGKDETP